MDVKLDDDQLQRAVDALKPAAEASSRLQNLKLLVEMTALVAAGLWALFIYLTVQRAANQLTREQTKHRLEATISIDPKAKITKLGPAGNGIWAFGVKYQYDISITSERNTPIAFVALEWFTGSPKQDPAHSFRANLPTTQGAITWTSRGVEVHTKPGFDAHLLTGPLTDASREVYLEQESEGGVGEYEPGDSIKEERIFYIAAKPDEWVGFHLAIGVERANGKIEAYYSKDAESLAIETAPREAEPAGGELAGSASARRNARKP